MKKLTTILAAVILTSGLAACSLQRPAANEWGCSFGQGLFEDTRGLKETRTPGGQGDWSNDKQITGPSDIRFYIVDSDPNTADAGGRPIEVPARGSVTDGVGVVNVNIETQVRFTFNENFCKWYIDHGKRNEPLNYEAKPGEPSGWNTFLNASMNQKLIEAARPVVAGQSYIDLYINAPIEGTPAFEVLASELSANLSRELEKDLGGVYFCGPSYKFDGEVDGTLGNCPPLEVTIKRIIPKDPTLIERLEQIVVNEEQKRLIDSNRQRQLAEIASDEEIQEREQERRQQVEVAQSQADQAIGEANAERDLAVTAAEQAVREQELINAQLAADAEAAFCERLAAQGVDCALYQAALAGEYPNVIVGQGGAEILVQP